MNKKNGFTMIELLVVIAIIGLLVAIVLAALGSARNKGSGASIQSELNSARSQAELYYNFNNYSYGSSFAAQKCPSADQAGTVFTTQANKGLLSLVTAIESSSGGAANTYCGSSGTAWAVAATLPTGEYWCVDSTNSPRNKNSSGTAYNALTSAAGGTGAFNTTSGVSCN